MRQFIKIISTLLERVAGRRGVVQNILIVREKREFIYKAKCKTKPRKSIYFLLRSAQKVGGVIDFVTRRCEDLRVGGGFQASVT